MPIKQWLCVRASEGSVENKPFQASSISPLLSTRALYSACLAALTQAQPLWGLGSFSSIGCRVRLVFPVPSPCCSWDKPAGRVIPSLEAGRQQPGGSKSYEVWEAAQFPESYHALGCGLWGAFSDFSRGHGGSCMECPWIPEWLSKLHPLDCPYPLSEGRSVPSCFML